MAAESKIKTPRMVTAPRRSGHPDIDDRSDVLVFVGRDQKDVSALGHAQNVARALVDILSFYGS